MSRLRHTINTNIRHQLYEADREGFLPSAPSAIQSHELPNRLRSSLRAEVESLAEEIEQSLALLRRRL